MFNEYDATVSFDGKKPCCEEPHSSDGVPPVRDGQKGGSGRQDTGHAERSRENDKRGRNGHDGHREHPQRPVEQQ